MSAAPTAKVDPLLARLDRLTAMLELALAPQLDAARERLRSDPLDAAIFDATAEGWIPAAELQRVLIAKTGAKKRTVQTHLGELVTAGHLEQRGGRRFSEYRSSGLI
jgi:hypothetical protein